MFSIYCRKFLRLNYNHIKRIALEVCDNLFAAMLGNHINSVITSEELILKEIGKLQLMCSEQFNGVLIIHQINKLCHKNFKAMKKPTDPSNISDEEMDYLVQKIRDRLKGAQKLFSSLRFINPADF